MSMVINPFWFASAAAVAAYDTNESLAEQTTTSATLDGATITATLEANSDYLFFWSQDLGTSSTGSTARTDLLEDASSIFTTRPLTTPREVTSPIDYHAQGGFYRYQEGATPSEHTWLLQAERSNAATLYLRNSRLSYLKMGADDEYAESIARQTFADPTNKTAQTAATLNFTPSSTGDYIVLASCLVDETITTNVQYGLELTDGTTTTGEVLMRPPQSADMWPTMLAIRLAGASGSTTVSLKCRQTGTGTTTIGISEIRIVAIRESRFANVYWSGLLGSDSAGTEGTYTTAHSQTFTPDAADHFTLAAWQMGGTSTTVSCYSQYLDDATAVNEYIREFGAAIADSGVGAISHRIAAYAASSRTQAIQRKSEATSNNQVQASAAIVTFDLAGIT